MIKSITEHTPSFLHFLPNYAFWIVAFCFQLRDSLSGCVFLHPFRGKARVCISIVFLTISWPETVGMNVDAAKEKIQSECEECSIRVFKAVWKCCTMIML